MAGVAERRQMLLDDPDLSKVEPHRVFCNRCDKWLKLDETKLYAASVWRCHKNTKSHNARAPVTSASAPPPWKGEGAPGPPEQQNASVPGSLPVDSQESQQKSPKAPPSRRPPSGDAPRLRSSDSNNAGTSTSVPQSHPRLMLKVPARSDFTRFSSRDTHFWSPSNPATQSGASKLGTPRPGSPAKPWAYSPTNLLDNGSASNSRPSLSKTAAVPEASSVASVTPSAQKAAGRPQLAQSGLSTQPGASQQKSSVSVKSVKRDTGIPPHRLASYKALVREPYIGDLEPFRAFCLLCDRWVDLSSRTPYSYGVWKGHVRKSEKHNRLQTNNAEDEYDTASGHSHEESGLPSAPDNVADAEKPVVANGVNGGSVSRTDSENAPSQGITSADLKGKGAVCPTENGHLPSGTTPSPPSLQQDSPSGPQDVGTSQDRPSTPNQFTLEAATHNSVGPHDQEDVTESNDAKVSLLEGDDMPVLTESSDEEPSTSQSPQKMSPAMALQKRRNAMIEDPDAAIVESRRVKCGICDRWIKGSNTQEYSSHHWLKHKKKCAARARVHDIDRLSETVEARKARLEADPDLETLEPHRALCGLCNKWVKLCGRSHYSASHWIQHKKKCPAVQGVDGSGVQMLSSDDLIPAHTVEETMQLQSSTNPPESRRDLLLADPDVLQLFPDRIQCRLCNRWIKLSMPVEYCPNHWYTHKEYCPGQATDSASKLQAALEARKKTLEEDSDVAELEPHRIRCGSCDSWVRLRQDCSYSLGKWQTHKKRCGQPSRGDQADSSADADADSEDAQIDDVGEDVREVMDVEGVLQHSIGQAGKQVTGLSRKEGQGVVVPAKTPDDDAEAERSNGIPDQSPSSRKVDDDDDVQMLDVQQGATNQADQKDIGGASKDDHEEIKPTEPPVVTELNAVEARRLTLLKDPDALRAEAFQVLCRRCQEWVLLPGPFSYVLGPWIEHKGVCAGESTVKDTDMPMLGSADHEPVRQPLPRRKGNLNKGLSGARSAMRPSRPLRPPPKGRKAAASKRAQSPLTLPPIPARPRWPDEDERKQQFIDDPDVKRVEPHRLLCKHCNCWIRLHPVIRYSQSVWPQHKVSCKENLLLVPGDARSRARSEKEDSRQRLLEEDSYATDVSPHRVTCRACGTSIRLDTTYKYEGSHWRAHRSRCSQIPFHERLPKKRKITEQVQEQVAIADSSDSDDSDASSAPRPRPTSFFTAPLVIRPTEMFKRRPRNTGPSASEIASNTAKAKLQAAAAAHLQEVAAQLNSSDRLLAIIQSAGDGTTSEERLAQQQNPIAPPEHHDPGVPEGGETPSVPRLSPSPDPESWVPRKRTREEEESFDTFFNRAPLPPTSPRGKGRMRVCKLGKEAMQVVD